MFSRAPMHNRKSIFKRRPQQGSLRLILCLVLVFYSNVGHTQSVLSSGVWIKLAVAQEGVFKVDYSYLQRAGLKVDELDPRNIRIFGNGGGILPQSNALPRPSDLQEKAIYISGEVDGRFNKDDFILFFIDGPSAPRFDKLTGLHTPEVNIYADQNFCFLTVSEDRGKRIAMSPDTGPSLQSITTFPDFVLHEIEKSNLLRSGREWYGESFNLNPRLSITFDIPGIVPASPVNVLSSVVGQSDKPSSLSLEINGVTMGTQSLAPISTSRYAVKGSQNFQAFNISSTEFFMDQRERHELMLQYAASGGLSNAYLDYIRLNFIRTIALYKDQTVFNVGLDDNPSPAEVIIEANSNDLTVWDITNTSEPLSQNFRLENRQARFGTTFLNDKRFIVFNKNTPAPTLVGKVANQNLHGLGPVDLIVITYPGFLPEAQRLAEHRRKFSDWSSVVVTTEQIYNEFSSGRQDVSAIRDFVRHLFNQGGSLKALLLFGKCSYDYKSRIQSNTNFVPTYQSRNSLDPLKTYSSDDYFAFLENNEGDWAENPSENHTMDIGVGRLPVTSVREAKQVVDKIIAYDYGSLNFGPWTKKISFVADDGNQSDGFTSLHQAQADELSRYAIENGPGIEVRKLFMGIYPKVVDPNGDRVPLLEDDILAAFNKGSLIINFTGHGSESLWTDERILTIDKIAQLDNEYYPLLVTATCEFGRHDDPAQKSGAELSVILKSAGAISAVTSTRPVYSSSNFALNIAFYESLFKAERKVIGEVFRVTKNNSVTGVSNRNFSLLGDPSLELALPEREIIITQIKTSFNSDTLKALSKVIVKGEVLDNNTSKKDAAFNGIVQAIVFDKEVMYETIGRNNPPFRFKQWSNALFRGQASVRDGEFGLEFYIPLNINYKTAAGKICLYAQDENGMDAKGSSDDFWVGGSEVSPITDQQSPTLKLFINDTTFVNGSVVSSDLTLMGKIEDNTGANISSYGIGNRMRGFLDNYESSSFVLDPYFISDRDNSSNGWITFDLKNVPPGRHAITVKAWDVFNNPAQASIDFIVELDDGVSIGSFRNYPNPFTTATTFVLTHNRTGEDISVQLDVHSVTGKSFLNREYQFDNASEEVVFEFDGNLPPGFYLASVRIRSGFLKYQPYKTIKLVVVE